MIISVETAGIILAVTKPRDIIRKNLITIK